jgi:hypothetical protein
MVKKGVPMPKEEPSDYDVIAHLNKIIAQRTSYGLRSETVIVPSYRMAWSNTGTWLIERAYGVRQPGEVVVLDANEILAPYRAATLERVIPFLNELPLFRFSFEAGSKKYSGPISDEHWVSALRADGKEVWDGQYPSDYSESLPNIHVDADKETLRSLGGGWFEDKDRYYDRADNPYTRHRFYTVRRK